MSKNKIFIGMLGLLLVVLSPITNAETNPFTGSDSSEGFMVAEGKCGDSMKKAEGKCGDSMKKAEGKCGEGKKKAAGKCGEGKCGEGVDMQGNVVKLGTFRYGGDNKAEYAGGKMATGVKDPAVCGTFSAAKCSVAHLK